VPPANAHQSARLDEILLTADEVVDRLMEDPALRAAAATCVLPAVRFGKEWRFRQTDLDAWIAEQVRR
jgi:excisionase family DNA binding protein